MLSLSSPDHVPVEIRVTETHEHNVVAQNRAQYRTFPELSELVWWLLPLAPAATQRAMS